ncbi:MAG: HEAT repeat domain-containing protein [Spirochaetales bacterium]|nr:HEAT repeat domain-containing protein [Spirochaetales bacterium]
MKRWYERSRRAFRIAAENNRPDNVTIERHSLHSEPVTVEGGVFIKITLISGPLLPIPLEIAKSASSLDNASRGSRQALRLGFADFAAIDRLEGDLAAAEGLERRPLPVGAIEDELRKLNLVCRSYSIYHDRITCLVPAEAGAKASMEARRSLARLATLLMETGKLTDLRLRLIQVRLRQSPDLIGHIEVLDALLKFYRNEEVTREVLDRVSRSRDFDAAYKAAKELGLDRLQFIITRVERSDDDNAVKAINQIRREKFSGGLEFLVAYLPRAGSAPLRRAVIDAFREYADPRAAGPLARLLDGGLAYDAVRALEACGDRGSLAPLHALASDKNRPVMLRKAAEEAMEKIRARLGIGKREEGSLALAGDEEPGGGLSLAGNEEPEGGLSGAEVDEGDPGG